MGVTYAYAAHLDSATNAATSHAPFAPVGDWSARPSHKASCRLFPARTAGIPPALQIVNHNRSVFPLHLSMPLRFLGDVEDLLNHVSRTMSLARTDPFAMSAGREAAAAWHRRITAQRVRDARDRLTLDLRHATSLRLRTVAPIRRESLVGYARNRPARRCHPRHFDLLVEPCVGGPVGHHGARRRTPTGTAPSRDSWRRSISAARSEIAPRLQAMSSPRWQFCSPANYHPCPGCLPTAPTCSQRTTRINGIMRLSSRATMRRARSIRGRSIFKRAGSR
jgi:hypothetical protein